MRRQPAGQVPGLAAQDRDLPTGVAGQAEVVSGYVSVRHAGVIAGLVTPGDGLSSGVARREGAARNIGHAERAGADLPVSPLCIYLVA